MLKEGVRLDRVRGGRQKYRRNPDSPYQIQVVSAQRPSLAIEGKALMTSLKVRRPFLASDLGKKNISRNLNL